MIEECLWRRLLDPVGNNSYRLFFHPDEPMPVQSLTGVPSGICPSLDENFLLNRGIPEPSHYQGNISWDTDFASIILMVKYQDGNAD